MRDKVSEIFFPYSHERVKDARSRKSRFVHYTNAEAAMSILQKKIFGCGTPRA